MRLNQDTKPEHAFYCADGRVLKNIRELAEELKGISPEAYRHHANESRNDFGNWIRDVYGNKVLAKKIASAKSSTEAARIIGEAILPEARRKKKTAERIKTASVKRKPAKRARKPAKKRKKAASAEKPKQKRRATKKRRSPSKKKEAAAATARKKEKKKPAEKIKKRRKAKRKIMLHKRIHRHLKRIARQWGFL